VLASGKLYCSYDNYFSQNHWKLLYDGKCTLGILQDFQVAIATEMLYCCKGVVHLFIEERSCAILLLQSGLPRLVG